MRKPFLILILNVIFIPFLFSQNTPIKVIVFGAHPDDCDLDGLDSSIVPVIASRPDRAGGFVGAA